MFLNLVSKKINEAKYNKLLLLKNKYARRSYIITIVGYILSLFIFYIGFPELESENKINNIILNGTFLALISVLIANGIYLLSNMIARHEIEENIGTELISINKRLEESFLDSSKSVVLLGRSDTIIKTAGDVIQSVERVRNTYVPFNTNPIYSDDLDNHIIETYRKILYKPSGEWEEVVVSTNSSESIKKREREIFDPKKLLKWQGIYRSYTVKSYPIINFLLTGSGEKPYDSVFFGWGYHENNNNGNVFFSRDPHMVEMFRLYFETLKEIAHESRSTVSERKILEKTRPAIMGENISSNEAESIQTPVQPKNDR